MPHTHRHTKKKNSLITKRLENGDANRYTHTRVVIVGAFCVSPPDLLWIAYLGVTKRKTNPALRLKENKTPLCCCCCMPRFIFSNGNRTNSALFFSSNFFGFVLFFFFLRFRFPRNPAPAAPYIYIFHLLSIGKQIPSFKNRKGYIHKRIDMHTSPWLLFSSSSLFLIFVFFFWFGNASSPVAIGSNWQRGKEEEETTDLCADTTSIAATTI